MNDNLQNKLNELKKGYVEKLKSSVINLQELLNNIEALNIEELYGNVHKISGTSGMYGFNELSSLSTEFELYLKEIKNGDGSFVQSELNDKLTQYIISIKNVIMEG